MDTRDGRILMALVRDPFVPLESIGREVGTSGTAVRARLDRLVARGVLRGFAAAPWASAFGRHGQLALFPQPSDASLDDVADVEDVAWAARVHTGATVAMLYSRAPLQAVPAELARRIGGPGKLAEPASPARAADPLSPLDWRVVDALMEEPRATLARHAELSGLAPRTVREKRASLVARGMMVTPILDATREPGEIVFTAHVEARDRDALQGVRIPGSVRVASHDAPPAVYHVGHAATYAGVQDIERRLRATPGVVDVMLSIPQGMAVAWQRLRVWTAQEAARWEQARRPRASD